MPGPPLNRSVLTWLSQGRGKGQKLCFFFCKESEFKMSRLLASPLPFVFCTLLPQDVSLLFSRVRTLGPLCQAWKNKLTSLHIWCLSGYQHIIIVPIRFPTCALRSPSWRPPLDLTKSEIERFFCWRNDSE